ncbi:MAG: hypothetical protein K2N48_01070 [Muribaculaceae bacterium]|nr:hypothetical protein [Muribaculaceae bacterium]
MTKEKNDMTNEHNFKVGDRVAAEDAEYSGIVTAVDDMGCKVRFADGEELFFLKDILHHSDLPDYDRRTAFLTRLQSLLKEHNATIQAYRSGVDTVGLCISFGDKHDIDYQQNDTICDVDADNIMDFDKD